MGCAAFAGGLDKKEFDQKLVRKIESFRPKGDQVSGESSVEVLDKGKIGYVSQLDRITEIQIEKNRVHDRFQNESTEMISPAKNSENAEILNPSPQNISTLDNPTSKKLNFEIHPHLFDFSFLDENTEQEELTDQVLKEVSNLQIYE